MNCDACHPLPLAAGATVRINGAYTQGFLCTTTGTITISRNNQDGTTTTLVTALPVTAGQWVDMPIYLGSQGGTIVSASAVGLLLTS